MVDLPTFLPFDNIFSCTLPFFTPTLINNIEIPNAYCKFKQNDHRHDCINCVDKFFYIVVIFDKTKTLSSSIRLKHYHLR